jgi:hypothetical protein
MSEKLSKVRELALKMDTARDAVFFAEQRLTQARNDLAKLDREYARALDEVSRPKVMTAGERR